MQVEWLICGYISVYIVELNPNYQGSLGRQLKFSQIIYAAIKWSMLMQQTINETKTLAYAWQRNYSAINAFTNKTHVTSDKVYCWYIKNCIDY